MSEVTRRHVLERRPVLAVGAAVAAAITIASCATPEAGGAEANETNSIQISSMPEVCVASSGISTEQRQDTDIPPVYIELLLATEDERFCDRGAVDVRSLARAFLSTLSGDPSGGGTIEMQVARTANPDAFSQDVVSRKIWEITDGGPEIGETLGKNGTMEAYLEIVPHGRNAYGALAASYAYFDKPLNQLGLHEMAIIIASVNAPNYYGGDRDLTNEQIQERLISLAERGLFVLNNGLKKGIITEEQYNQAVYDTYNSLNFTVYNQFTTQRVGIPQQQPEQQPTQRQQPDAPVQTETESDSTNYELGAGERAGSWEIVRTACGIPSADGEQDDERVKAALSRTGLGNDEVVEGPKTVAVVC